MLHRSEIKVDDNNKNSLNFAISSHNTNVDTRAGIGFGIRRSNRERVYVCYNDSFWIFINRNFPLDRASIQSRVQSTFFHHPSPHSTYDRVVYFSSFFSFACLRNSKNNHFISTFFPFSTRKKCEAKKIIENAEIFTNWKVFPRYLLDAKLLIHRRWLYLCQLQHC